ncbi:MAG: hypothetical protein A2279_02595 [Stygiobacter sp. RIFOXYA12_FULL_38_9]|nr:SpoIIE family protein phosphatase [Ignavibacteriota bacterium]OGU63715.1 MAG: hypothetical protein A2X62_12960 [Stygiobacter sp. GWC2_38_9]OGU77404.1 MAG: hypothetical protein A2279_02595 [Stygiobacter sp. RIFOXYA12_FULL_38_9]OGV08521.1 MAG: hypothetical protein A2299_00510 [Stygiobacter sp. RIFOXYB2_FULL_37_11]OGV10274.1 MAG: hypothetical protein A2237_10845 [Stygiobacter sp. RIFOXYA2_FULL_38_8]OGV14827.1 MAG: hypothetical protein A2440_10015 [Stygiobacter sp. RIFOXYC2_FULL_38_25]OGV79320
MAHVTGETVYLSRVAYSTSSVIFPGQNESGDLYIIKEFPEKVIVGVVDGMGHGHEAAIAAKCAVDTLEANADLSIMKLVKLCHEKLKNTRGVVLALASINYTDDTLTWLSIGNVEGVLLRADSETKPAYESIFMCRGVLGYNLSQLYATIIPISKGDLLILSTDGIRSDYFLRFAADSQFNTWQPSYPEWPNDNLASEPLNDLEEPTYTRDQIYSDDSFSFTKGLVNISPQNVAEYITKRFVKGSDDALVTVVKYLEKNKPSR